MQIAIKDIRPNPFRDFDLYPVAEDQVEKLMASLGDQGQWQSLPARRSKDGTTYEIAAGHHRLEAARRLKIKEIDLSVAKRSDDQMLRIMIQENATQRGHNAASTLDSVAAAMGQITYLVLTDTSPEFRRSICKDDRGFETLRGRIEAGTGIGCDVVHAFLPPNSLTRSEVDEALAIIKASDKHLDIIKRVKARIAAEAKDNAKLKPEVVAAAERAVSATKAKQDAKPVLFDATCAQFFDNDSQVQVFRKAVTNGVMAEALPYDKQVELARSYSEHVEKLAAHAEKNGSARVRKTETGLREFLNDNIAKFMGAATKAERDARNEALKHNATMRIQAARDDILRGIATAGSGFTKLRAELSRWPKNEPPPVMGDLLSRMREFAKLITDAMSVIR